MTSQFEHKPGPAVGLQEALSEKAFAAERAIAGLRLFVIAANTIIYTVFTDKSGTVAWLAYTVIVLSSVYGLYVYFFEPYRRFAVFLSAYFSSISDAALIMVWLFATGGLYSSFYILLYPAIVSVAFRFTAGATVFAAFFYSSAYLGLLLALKQLAGHGQEVLVRVTYVFLMAALGQLISKEVLQQVKRRISYKEQMKAVEAAEVKFRAVAETANDAIISTDASGTITYSNPSAQRMFGYSGRQMVGIPISALIEERGLVGRTIAVVAKRRDSSGFPAELSLAAWTLPEARYYTAVVRDITERMKSQQTALDLVREQTLRVTAEEAEQRSVFLAEASRILGASLDHEAGLKALARLVVPAFADRCTIDLIESDGALSKRVVQATCESANASPLDSEARLQPISGELAGVVRSGRTFILPEAATLFIVPISGQRIYGAITFALNDSARRFTQTEIAIGEALGQRAAVAVEHSQLYKEAQAAIQARDDFLSVASHELNTPLTTLQLQMDLLLQQSRSEGRKTLRRMELARRQVARLTNLIRNLLDVSRISSRKLALELEDVDLSEVVQEAVERVEEARRSAGSPLEFSSPGPVIGRWDRVRVDQVVSNLLSNAIKYGEGKQIEVSVEQAGDLARLKVRDSGIGIPLAEQTRIFDRFSRVHSARRYSGFGLGLWIVQQIVGELGGRIKLVSQPGEGSTFVVELPLSAAPSSTGEPASSEPTQLRGRLG